MLTIGCMSQTDKDDYTKIQGPETTFCEYITANVIPLF